MGYWYNHSDGVSLTVWNTEYLEPPGILGHHLPRVFRVRSGLNQSCSLEHGMGASFTTLHMEGEGNNTGV